MEEGGGPYLCGDQYTLADVSMVGQKMFHNDSSKFSNLFKVPIFEQMDDFNIQILILNMSNIQDQIFPNVLILAW